MMLDVIIGLYLLSISYMIVVLILKTVSNLLNPPLFDKIIKNKK